MNAFHEFDADLSGAIDRFILIFILILILILILEQLIGSEHLIVNHQGYVLMPLTDT